MSGFFVESAVLGHVRFRNAGAGPSWLWTQAGVWSATEGEAGFVSMLAVRAYGTLPQARKLVEVGLWEETEGGFRFLKWRNGHPTPETDGEERRRKDRERKRIARANAKVDTSPVRGQSADKPPLSADSPRTRPRTAPGLDTTSSLVIPPLSPPQGGAPAEPVDQPRTKTVRRTRLPKSWTPSDLAREYAAVHRLDLDAEAEKFRNYHAMKGTLGIDWHAGFRNWMQKAIEYRDERVAARPAAKAEPTRADLKPFSYDE